MKDCTIKNCEEPFYAKGFCANHYQKFRKTGNPFGTKVKKCGWPDCGKMIIESFTFCNLHRNKGNFRIKNNLPLDNTDYRIIKMLYNKNPRWSGGNKGYKDHAEMKKNRLIKLQKQKGICEICGGNNGYHIHHKDGTTDNHSVENLIVVCVKCHCALHPITNTKFLRLYGQKAETLSENLNCSLSKIYRYHRQGTLKDYISTFH